GFGQSTSRFPPGCLLRSLAASVFGLSLSDFSFEPRQDRFEESILNQTQHGFPRARLRRLDVSGNGGLGSDFLTRRIGQQRRDSADQALVEFAKKAFFPVLARIVHVHVSKQRLYVALNFTLPDF